MLAYFSYLVIGLFVSCIRSIENVDLLNYCEQLKIKMIGYYFDSDAGKTRIEQYREFVTSYCFIGHQYQFYLKKRSQNDYIKTCVPAASKHFDKRIKEIENKLRNDNKWCEALVSNTRRYEYDATFKRPEYIIFPNVTAEQMTKIANKELENKETKCLDCRQIGYGFFKVIDACFGTPHNYAYSDEYFEDLLCHKLGALPGKEYFACRVLLQNHHRDLFDFVTNPLKMPKGILCAEITNCTPKDFLESIILK